MVTGSTTDAQAQAKVTVRPVSHQTRVPMCSKKMKGLYTFDGRVFVHGYCLSNVDQTAWMWR
jgi:hypothetical protein